MSEKMFSIARDFSPHPGPRFKDQGQNSGEMLRRKLAGLLRQSTDTILIDLDGTRGIGSSFLDEAFGGLVRSEGIAKDDLIKRFKFRSLVDPSYIDEILDSIKRAVPAG